MIATRPRTHQANRLSHDLAPAKAYAQTAEPVELMVGQEGSYDLVIMAATAVVVICVLAVTLGWQIAVILAVGLTANTVAARRAKRSAA